MWACMLEGCPDMNAGCRGGLFSVFLFSSLPYFEGDRRNLSLNVKLAVLIMEASKPKYPSVTISPMPTLSPQPVLPCPASTCVLGI